MSIDQSISMVQKINEPIASMVGDLADPELNVLEKPFEINKVELNEEFNSSKNQRMIL